MYKTTKTTFSILPILFTFFHSVDDIPAPDQLDGSTPTLLVADDVMLEKQANISRLFCRGRHKNCHVIYLTQRFATMDGKRGGIPPLIRSQLTMLCLFHGIENKSLRSIFDEYASGDMDWAEFQDFFRQATPRRYDFAVLDIRELPYAGKYRKGFEYVYISKEWQSFGN